MGPVKAISFELQSDFGFLRKPETNDGLQPSFNMLHKPALLGVLGAILGLGGYGEKGKWPEYYLKLKHLQVGIAPQIGRHERGNFSRTVLTYTNGVGYANTDGNLIVTETTLIAPGYEVFLLLDEKQPLHQALGEALAKGEACFIPYLGKNEHYAWWDTASVKWYDAVRADSKADAPFSIDSIFYKQQAVAGQREEGLGLFLDNLDSEDYLYFERLPIGFDEALQQYRYADFAYSTCKWQPGINIENLYLLNGASGTKRVQLF
jgi:CRISPR-associated protein Cas5h